MTHAVSALELVDGCEGGLEVDGCEAGLEVHRRRKGGLEVLEHPQYFSGGCRAPPIIQCILSVSLM